MLTYYITKILHFSLIMILMIINPEEISHKVRNSSYLSLELQSFLKMYYAFRVFPKFYSFHLKNPKKEAVIT